MRNPEGESDHGPLRPLFGRRLKLEFHGSRVTSDAGLLAYRELDDALGLTALAGGVLADSRTGRNGWHGIVSLLRQSVYGRLAGYEDVNDADRLGRDPAMRWIVGGKAVERGGASTSQMGRFETELLANNENLAALADLSGMWIDRGHDHDPPRRVVLDMDSSVSPTFGEQEGTAYNGHFGCTCYHPLFVFNQFGDLERCALRPGNVHSAHGWRDVLVPVVERYKERAIRLYFRGDAAFASPEIYDYLEAEGMLYAIRLPANKVLQESIAHLLKRPVGRPPKDVRRYHASFSYQAGTWDKTRSGDVPISVEIRGAGRGLFEQCRVTGERLLVSRPKRHGIALRAGALAQIVVCRQNFRAASGEGGDCLGMAPAEGGTPDIPRDAGQRVVVGCGTDITGPALGFAGGSASVLPDILTAVLPYTIGHVVERRLLRLRARPAFGQIRPDLGVRHRNFPVVVRSPVGDIENERRPVDVDVEPLAMACRGGIDRLTCRPCIGQQERPVHGQPLG